jgi:hypothetical protein
LNGQINAPGGHAGGSCAFGSTRGTAGGHATEVSRSCSESRDSVADSAICLAIDRWSKLLEATRLKVLPDPPFAVVQEIYNKYIGVMRHKADIPILAAALECLPPVHVILSGNTEHFNPAVATRSGVLICSCVEFIEMLGKTKP